MCGSDCWRPVRSVGGSWCTSWGGGSPPSCTSRAVKVKHRQAQIKGMHMVLWQCSAQASERIRQQPTLSPEARSTNTHAEKEVHNTHAQIQALTLPPRPDCWRLVRSVGGSVWVQGRPSVLVARADVPLQLPQRPKVKEKEGRL